MIEDSGIGKPRTIEERLSELERQMAVIFKHCPPSPGYNDYTAKAKRKERKRD